MIKKEDWLSYVHGQVENGSIYVWGGQGQTGSALNEDWIRKKEKSTGGNSKGTYADQAVATWKKRLEDGYTDCHAYDCSGLVMYYLENVTHEVKKDMTADGIMHNLCAERKDIQESFLVFRTDSKGKATHVGVVVEGNNVIHAKGRAEGVVCEPYKKSYWQAIGRLLCIDDGYEPDPDPPDPPDPEPPEPQDKKVLVIGKSVSVRSEPNKSSRRIDIVHKGNKLPYLGTESNGWYKVTDKGKEAYISGREDLTKVVES